MDCSSRLTYGSHRFSGQIARGLCAAVPGARNPIDAILWHAKRLILEAGIKDPPYNPTLYAPLRSVDKILEKRMEIEGRLVPIGKGFVVELRKDRSAERKNFTCAHEIAHTFFYESVGSIKRRKVGSPPGACDREEEVLCDIAAAELLMPSRRFLEIASDFSASPTSVVNLARIFETSLMATATRLLQLDAWNIKLALWEVDERGLKPRWLARPKVGLKHSPDLTIKDEENSGISRAILSRQSVISDEWLTLRGQEVFYHVESMPLNSKLVLCSLSSKTEVRNRPGRSLSPSLPFQYGCMCDGTGWLLSKINGYKVAMKCRATIHRKS